MVRWSLACSGNPGLGLTLTQFEAALRRQAAREAVTSAAANSRRMSSAESEPGAGARESETLSICCPNHAKEKSVTITIKRGGTKKLSCDFNNL